MIFKRLLAFGCSLTFGEGLEDCIRSSESGKTPSKFAWPEVLGAKLDLEVKNYSRPGSSNKEIWHKIVCMQPELTKNDLIIIHWSYHNRTCVFCDDLSRVNTLDEQIGGWSNDKKAIAYFKYFNSDYEGITDSYMRAMFIKMYLDKLRIKNFHTNNLWHFYPPVENLPNMEWTKKMKFIEPSLGEIRCNYPLALDGHHPGKEAHRNFANILYREISNEIKI